MSGGPFLYPNVSSVPSRADGERTRQPGEKTPVPGEFGQVLENTLSPAQSGVDLNAVRQPLKFSAHALQRLNERKIAFDSATLSRMNTAIDKAAAKGVQDTLVLTPEAALTVSVKNRTVVTALDRVAMDGNVFTNIDGAVIV